MDTITRLLMIVGIISLILILLFFLASIFSRKLRDKLIGNQLKVVDRMLDSSADTMGDLVTKGAKISRQALEKSKDDLKVISSMQAEIEEDAIKARARAVREGLLNENMIFCMYCGKEIQVDSKYCKYCGKEI